MFINTIRLWEIRVIGINTELITEPGSNDAKSVDGLCINAFHTNCLKAGDLGILVL